MESGARVVGFEETMLAYVCALFAGAQHLQAMFESGASNGRMNARIRVPMCAMISASRG